VGGSSRCEGDLELRHEGEWRPLFISYWNRYGPEWRQSDRYQPWNLKAAEVACRDLDCGSAVSVAEREESSHRDVWRIYPNCLDSGSALRDCAEPRSSPFILNLTCSGKPIIPNMHLSLSVSHLSVSHLSVSHLSLCLSLVCLSPVCLSPVSLSPVCLSVSVSGELSVHRKRIMSVSHLSVSHLSVSHLSVSHLFVSHLSVSHLSVSHLFVSHLSVSHLSVSHLSVSHLSVSH